MSSAGKPAIDYSQFSNEELTQALAQPNKAAPQAAADSQKPNLSNYSDDEIKQALAQQVGGLESFGRGAEQMATVGYAPQINARIQSVFGKGDYESNLARQRASQDAAWEQHPYAYGSGAVASMIPAAFASAFTGGAPEEAAALGYGAKALAALKNSSNLASLTAGGLEGLAGEGTSAIRALAGGTGRFLNKPWVQGAIYGSAEGDTAEDKTIGAIEGGIGGKLGEKVIGGITSVGSALVRAASRKFYNMLAGDPSSGSLAAAAADKLKLSIPSAITFPSWFSKTSTAIDPFHHIPIAAGKTLAGAEERFSALHDGTTPAQAGEALQSAADTWLNGAASNPGSSRAALENIYSRVPGLSESTGFAPIDNLRTVVKTASEDPNFSKQYKPTIELVQQALDNPQGLTLNAIRQLRTVVSDNMNFRGLPQDASFNQDLLGDMRGALTKDLHSAADLLLENGAGALVKNADAQAKNIYDARSLINNTIGTDPARRSPANVFANLKRTATVKGGNPAVLGEIRDIISHADPDAWERFSQGYIADMAQSGPGFRLGDFARSWGRTDPAAKDILFSPYSSNPASAAHPSLAQMNTRQALDTLEALARHAGGPIDEMGSNPEVQNFIQTGEGIGLFAGDPDWKLKVLKLTGLGAAGGIHGAQNAAAALPKPTYRSVQIAKYPALENFINAGKRAEPGAISNFATDLAKKSGIPAGAYLANKYALPAGRLGLLGAGSLYAGAQGYTEEKLKAIEEPEGIHASGGRVSRASGGAVNHASEAERLVALADRAKKSHNNQTKPLLAVPDETITHALAIANDSV